MPKNRLWTYSELSRVIPLRYGGLTYTEIARRLTSENLKALGLPDTVFDALDAINKNRYRDTRQKHILGQMSQVACVFEYCSFSELQSAVLMPPRLQYFEKNNPIYGELLVSYTELAEHCDAYAAMKKSEWQERVAKKDGSDE